MKKTKQAVGQIWPVAAVGWPVVLIFRFISSTTLSPNFNTFVPHFCHIYGAKWQPQMVAPLCPCLQLKTLVFNQRSFFVLHGCDSLLFSTAITAKPFDLSQTLLNHLLQYITTDTFNEKNSLSWKLQLSSISSLPPLDSFIGKGNPSIWTSQSP